MTPGAPDLHLYLLKNISFEKIEIESYRKTTRCTFHSFETRSIQDTLLVLPLHLGDNSSHFPSILALFGALEAILSAKLALRCCLRSASFDDHYPEISPTSLRGQHSTELLIYLRRQPKMALLALWFAVCVLAASPRQRSSSLDSLL